MGVSKRERDADGILKWGSMCWSIVLPCKTNIVFIYLTVHSCKGNKWCPNWEQANDRVELLNLCYCAEAPWVRQILFLVGFCLYCCLILTLGICMFLIKKKKNIWIVPNIRMKVLENIHVCERYKSQIGKIREEKRVYCNIRKILTLLNRFTRF